MPCRHDPLVPSYMCFPFVCSIWVSARIGRARDIPKDDKGLARDLSPTQSAPRNRGILCRRDSSRTASERSKIILWSIWLIDHRSHSSMVIESIWIYDYLWPMSQEYGFLVKEDKAHQALATIEVKENELQPDRTGKFPQWLHQIVPGFATWPNGQKGRQQLEGYDWCASLVVHRYAWPFFVRLPAATMSMTFRHWQKETRCALWMDWALQICQKNTDGLDIVTISYPGTI